jgi:hypothetical protein
MGLRAFHLFFIGSAAVLSLFVCAWAYLEHVRTHALSNMLESTLALAASGCLVAYFLWARKSYRLPDKKPSEQEAGHH